MRAINIFLGVALLLGAGFVIVTGAGWRFFSRGPSLSSQVMGNTTRESSRAHLGELRSALSIYYGDMEGQYPASLAGVAVPRWMSRMPSVDTGVHPASSAEVLISNADYAAGRFPDKGGWYYVVDGANQGNVGVDCVHTDLAGKKWSSY